MLVHHRIPGMKWLRVLLLLPWMGCLSITGHPAWSDKEYCYSPQDEKLVHAGVPPAVRRHYPFIHRGEEKHGIKFVIQRLTVRDHRAHLQTSRKTVPKVRQLSTYQLPCTCLCHKTPFHRPVPHNTTGFHVGFPDCGSSYAPGGPWYATDGMGDRTC